MNIVTMKLRIMFLTIILPQDLIITPMIAHIRPYIKRIMNGDTASIAIFKFCVEPPSFTSSPKSLSMQSKLRRTPEEFSRAVTGVKVTVKYFGKLRLNENTVVMT